MVNRFLIAVLLALTGVSLHAQDKLGVKIGELRIEEPQDPAASPGWVEALERAKRERKPILAFEKTQPTSSLTTAGV